MLGAKRLGRALGVNFGADLVEPDVAAIGHRCVNAGVADDEDRLESLQLAHCFVHLRLDRRRLTFAPRAIGNEEGLGV